jgi:hypothetical protein
VQADGWNIVETDTRRIFSFDYTFVSINMKLGVWHQSKKIRGLRALDKEVWRVA